MKHLGQMAPRGVCSTVDVLTFCLHSEHRVLLPWLLAEVPGFAPMPGESSRRKGLAAVQENYGAKARRIQVEDPQMSLPDRLDKGGAVMSDASELLEKARRSLRAAELHAEGRTYAAIAGEIGADSPAGAKKACDAAWKMLDVLRGGNGTPPGFRSLTVTQLNDLTALIRRKIAVQQEWQQHWDAMTDQQRQETTEKAKAAMPPYLRDMLWPGDEADDGPPIC